MLNRKQKQPGLTAESADGHLLTADGEQLAFYVAGQQRWSFRSDQERLSLVQACAVHFSAFTGRRVRVRVTTRPFPESEWARRLDADVRSAPGSGPLPAWDDLLGKQQERLARLALADELVYLAVPVIGKPGSAEAAADVAKMTAQLAGPGLDARPATAGELEYLLHRSCALGTPHPLTMPPPMVAWTEDDLAGFAAQHLDWSQAPLGRSVRVTAEVNGQLVERFVVVGTMTRKPVIALPGEKGGGAAPWLKRATVGFNVEWSVIADVLEPAVVTSRMVDVVNAVAAQAAHAREHGEQLRKSLLTQSLHANDVIDQVESQDPLAAWLDVWVRFAVSGRTEQEAMSRFQQVADLYAPGFTFEAPRRGMHAAAREFIPGEPLSTTAHRRRMTVMEFAAGMPHVAGVVGDKVGFHIGRTVTSTTSRAVCWHPFAAQEIRESSGVTVVAGTLGSGKALAFDTPIPTPTGWTTMGDLRVGDQVIGGDGKPVRVVAATESMVDRPCYRIGFADGASVVADAGHQWLTWTLAARERAMKDSRRTRDRVAGYDQRTSANTPHIRTTAEIAATVMTANAYPQTNHAIPVVASQFPHADLPIDPYVLGVWLGDGTSSCSAVTLADADADEIIPLIEARGVVARRYAYILTAGSHIHLWALGQLSDSQYTMTERNKRDHLGRRVNVSLHSQLRRLGVLGCKHIPSAYLRSDEQQRRDLLAGLLDTDGYCCPSGSVEFAVTEERLARGTHELVLSLGYKATLRTKPCSKGRPGRQTVFTVAFTADEKVFNLSRKAARQNPTTGRGQSMRRMHTSTRRFRYITSADQIESVPVRCIQVDAEDGLFLATKNFIPTHNSSLVGSVGAQVAMAGIPAVILDLGGPLANLCALPEFAGAAKATDLMQAEPGALSPYRVISDPLRAHYDTDPEYTRAYAFAAARRRMLAQDTLMTLLPAGVASMPKTAFAMSEATRAVGGQRWHSPHSVLDALETSDHGRFLAGLLRDAAELPQTQLIFPERSTELTEEDRASADGLLLQVLTMRGLVTPKDGAKREAWTLEQTVGAALLNLAAHHTSQQVYGIGDMHRRKFVALDEVGLLTAVASGRQLVAQLAADSRKWNLRLMLSGMNVQHALLSEVGVENYVDSLFIGRTVGKDAIRDALTACHVELGVGYEEVLPRLSPQPRDAVERLGYRDFVFYDGKGGCETVRITQPPGVEDALNTTADPTRAKVSRPRLATVPA